MLFIIIHVERVVIINKTNEINSNQFILVFWDNKIEDNDRPNST